MHPHTPFIGFESGWITPDAAGIQSIPSIQQSIEAFRKATLTAGYGTDVAALTGGGALRLQSIESSLAATIPLDKHFKLFNRIAQGVAGATVHEFTIQDDIGGFPGSGFNSELGVIAEDVGNYARKTVQIKYLMVRRSVSAVHMAQKALVDAVAREKINGARQIKTSVEWALFNGDSTVLDLEFDGLGKIIGDTNDADLIKDARGEGLSSMGREILDLAQAITEQGRFGQATDLYCSPAVQNSEFDQKLDPGVRIPLDPAGGRAAREMGTPVVGINTSWGKIMNNPDVFIQEGGMPWQVAPGTKPAIVTAAGLTAPAAPTVAAGAHASSKFTSDHAGAYYYAVESIGKLGRSACNVSAQVTVVAGDRVTVTITNPADANVTGFALYRSRKNGTNAKTDLREMVRIPRVGAADGVATTVYHDTNSDIPGTSRVYVLNLTPGDEAVKLVRLLPMTMFPLFPTNQAVRPWAQLFFCALMAQKPKQHGMVKNVLPRSAAWRPFN